MSHPQGPPIERWLLEDDHHLPNRLLAVGNQPGWAGAGAGAGCLLNKDENGKYDGLRASGGGSGGRTGADLNPYIVRKEGRLGLESLKNQASGEEDNRTAIRPSYDRDVNDERPGRVLSGRHDSTTSSDILGLTVQCETGFMEVLNALLRLEGGRYYIKRMRDSQDRFRLWAEIVGALTIARRSLDNRLELYSNLRMAVVQLLKLLKDNLHHGQFQYP